jgi:hypothetical protein
MPLRDCAASSQESLASDQLIERILQCVARRQRNAGRHGGASMVIARLFFERAGRCVLLAATALAAACTTPGYVIEQAIAGSTVTCSPATGTGPCMVTAQVAWHGVSVHPTPDLSIDGTAVAHTLSVPPTGNFVSGTLSMPPGPHQIDVAGLLSGGGSIAPVAERQPRTHG